MHVFPASAAVGQPPWSKQELMLGRHLLLLLLWLLLPLLLLIMIIAMIAMTMTQTMMTLLCFKLHGGIIQDR